MAASPTTDRSGETRSANDALIRVYVVCPYCGLRYRQIEGSLYKPKTCSQYQCVKRSLHPYIVRR